MSAPALDSGAQHREEQRAVGLLTLARPVSKSLNVSSSSWYFALSSFSVRPFLQGDCYPKILSLTCFAEQTLSGARRHGTTHPFVPRFP